MYVCICHAVTDHQIVDAVDGGVQDIGQLGEHCGAGTNCGRCRDTAQELIDQRLAETISYAA